MNIVYNPDLYRGILKGMDMLANAVKGTLGPKGRNVAMHQKANLPDADYSDPALPGAPVLITNDGATAAKGIVLKDPLENLGVRFIREAAEQTKKTAGDGTTTAAVLTQAILREALPSLEAGANPIAVRRGMKKAGQLVEQELQKAAVPIHTEEEISRVAAISCQDEDMGRRIGQAFAAVGLEGVINVEDSRRLETSLEIQEGIVFDRGLLSPMMATDENQLTAELEDPYILLCDNRLTSRHEILPFLMLAAEDGHPCLIISDGVEGDALGIILRSRTEGDLQIACVTAPEYGEGRRWRMEDLAVQTGGIYITKEYGLDVKNVTREMIGTAGHVKITQHQTVITDPGGNPEAINKRVQELRFLASHTDYEFNRNRFRERLAKFVSGVAYLRVGGHTETEIWELKMRTEDAVHTARAACEEGIVPGGGIALLNIAPQVKTLALSLAEDERAGALAVCQALKAPARQILENAGQNGNARIEHLLQMAPDIGYDVCTDEYTNMLTAGILDPVKVTRLAFLNALSLASTAITLGAGITGEKEQTD